MVRYFALAFFVLVFDFGFKYQFLGVIIHRLSCVLEFAKVEPLAVDEFPYFCDELAGPF